MPSTDSHEANLWAAYREQDDASAREELFLCYLPYARAVAARLFGNRLKDDVEFGDYHQLACIGLLQALDKFDISRGVSFKTYCTHRMEGNVLSGVERLTEAQQQISLAKRLKNDRLKSLKSDPAEIPRFPEIADMALGLALGFLLEDTGMFSPESDVGTENPYTSLAWKRLRSQLFNSIQTLPKRENRLIVLHYLHGVSFEQIAELFGVTKGRVSQIHRSALIALKSVLD